jgi:hypothetical protein
VEVTVEMLLIVVVLLVEVVLAQVVAIVMGLGGRAI